MDPDHRGLTTELQGILYLRFEDSEIGSAGEAADTCKLAACAIRLAECKEVVETRGCTSHL